MLHKGTIVMRTDNTHSDTSALIRERAQRLYLLDHELKKLFPSAGIALRYESPWQLLVAVMLSAQCTDKKVNEVTKVLFARYPKLSNYRALSHAELEELIHPTGFFRAKAKHILAAAQRLEKEYNGRVPRIMEELLTVPGVARKTANVVLGNAYGIVEGIAVDTHVKRFAVRFDLTDSTDPVVIERDLMQLLPREDWFGFTYRAIEYGRTIAPARKYDTSKDPLVAIYPKAGERFRV